MPSAYLSPGCDAGPPGLGHGGAAEQQEARRTAAKTLGILGAITSGGYPAEKSIRQAWRGKSSDASVTPMTAAATALAALMAALGRREMRRLPKAS